MSVAGCYTDFHIDFGGTSVWYHILHGEKVGGYLLSQDKLADSIHHKFSCMFTTSISSLLEKGAYS